jgi:hypothetical protein
MGVTQLLPTISYVYSHFDNGMRCEQDQTNIATKAGFF